MVDKNDPFGYDDKDELGRKIENQSPPNIHTIVKNYMEFNDKVESIRLGQKSIHSEILVVLVLLVINIILSIIGVVV